MYHSQRPVLHNSYILSLTSEEPYLNIRLHIGEGCMVPPTNVGVKGASGAVEEYVALITAKFEPLIEEAIHFPSVVELGHAPS